MFSRFRRCGQVGARISHQWGPVSCLDYRVGQVANIGMHRFFYNDCADVAKGARPIFTTDSEIMRLGTNGGAPQIDMFEDCDMNNNNILNNINLETDSITANNGSIVTINDQTIIHGRSQVAVGHTPNIITTDGLHVSSTAGGEIFIEGNVDEIGTDKNNLIGYVRDTNPVSQRGFLIGHGVTNTMRFIAGNDNGANNADFLFSSAQTFDNTLGFIPSFGGETNILRLEVPQITAYTNLDMNNNDLLQVATISGPNGGTGNIAFNSDINMPSRDITCNDISITGE